MFQKFYYLEGKNQQKGPLSIDQLKTVGIKSDTLVWTEGLSDWKPAKEVDELKNLMSKPPPPPPPPIPQPPPASTPINTTTVIAKNFRCDGCGASLQIPNNARGNVKCPHCKNDCWIDSIIKNAEIAAKENINSGISLSASPVMLHDKLILLLSESPCIPFDVFGQIEVVREERYCIPAYCFECTGEASFTYEVAEKRKQTYTVGSGNDVEVKEKTHIDWKNMNDRTNISEIVFVSGNKNFIPQIEKLYICLDSGLLVDFEELDFPLDVQTFNYNLPQPTAFNDHIKPYMERILQQKAKKSLDSKNVRNFSMGGSMIQKEITRVFLGLYHVVYEYNGAAYSMWVTGDGKKGWLDGMPEDINRKSAFDKMKQEMDLIDDKEKSSSFCSKTWQLVSGFSFQLHLLATLFTAGFYLAIVGFIYVQQKSEKEKYQSQRAKVRNDIDGLIAQSSKAAQQFRLQQKNLRGIYKNV